jgi:hypothetical protein
VKNAIGILLGISFFSISQFLLQAFYYIVLGYCEWGSFLDFSLSMFVVIIT